MRFCLRTRGSDVETWPDGRGIADQPIRLIRSVGVVHEYLNENAPQKGPAPKRPGKKAAMPAA